MKLGAVLLPLLLSSAHAQSPQLLPYGQPVYAPPPGYVPTTAPEPERVVRQPRWRLFGAGLALFLVGYLGDISITYGLGHEPASESAIPIAGPLMQLRDSYSEDNKNLATPFLVTGFAMQAAGALMAILGLALWTKVPAERPVVLYAQPPVYAPGYLPPPPPVYTPPPPVYSPPPPLYSPPPPPPVAALPAPCPPGQFRQTDTGPCMTREQAGCPNNEHVCNCPERHHVFCHPTCRYPDMCDGSANPEYPCGSPIKQTGWDTTAGSHRCQVSAEFQYLCPPGGVIARVWGTGIYTDDSSVCSAAVHAGRISPAQGGTITIQMQPGQKSYSPSSANGIDSISYGEWACSFSVR